MRPRNTQDTTGHYKIPSMTAHRFLLAYDTQHSCHFASTISCVARCMPSGSVEELGCPFRSRWDACLSVTPVAKPFWSHRRKLVSLPGGVAPSFRDAHFAPAWIRPRCSFACNSLKLCEQAVVFPAATPMPSCEHPAKLHASQQTRFAHLWQAF